MLDHATWNPGPLTSLRVADSQATLFGQVFGRRPESELVDLITPGSNQTENRVFAQRQARQLAVNALLPSGATAGTYGSATQVATVTIDSQGVVTSASSTTISLPSNLVEVQALSRRSAEPEGPAAGDLTGFFPKPELAASGVAPATYGSATQVAVVTLDAKGRATAASNTAISGLSNQTENQVFARRQEPLMSAGSLAPSGATAGTYGTATQVATITVNSQGIITAVSNTDITSSGASNQTENQIFAQRWAPQGWGYILWSYSAGPHRLLPAGNGITVSVTNERNVQIDIATHSHTYVLIGTDKLLGGDGSGFGTEITPSKSVEINSGLLELDGDSATPGSSKYYGTNSSGTKGWHSLSMDQTETAVFARRAGLPPMAAAGLLAGRQVGQIVTATTGENATGTTVMPYDDTIPQNTEGVEFLTATITPRNASSTLLILFNGMLVSSVGNQIAVALFQDTTADALAVACSHGGAAETRSIPLVHVMTAGTQAATTFKIRAHGQNAGTIAINGTTGGARRYGGRAMSILQIIEILP